MARQTRYPLFAAYHVRDSHLVVVDDVGQVIRRVTVGFEDHEILEKRQIESQPTSHLIFDLNITMVRHLESHDDVETAISRLLNLFGRSVSPAVVISGRLPSGLLPLTQRCQFLRLRVVVICVTRFDSASSRHPRIAPNAPTGYREHVARQYPDLHPNPARAI